MSNKTMAAAALSGIFALSTSQTLASEKSCTTQNINGQLTLVNIEEHIGEKRIKPMNEAVLNLSCGDRLGAQISGDFTSNQALDYDSTRRERLTLSYKIGDLNSPLEITGGYIGEYRMFEGIFTSAGKRPHVGLEQTLVTSRVENPELLGVILNKNLKLSDQWNLSLEGATFKVSNQNDNPPNLLEDRGNSTDLSFHTKAKIQGQGLTLGFESGKTQHGVLGNADEKYLGLFAKYKTPLNDNLVWMSAIERINFNNFNNQEGVSKNLTVASSHLSYQPETMPTLTLWGQIGANIDSISTDKAFFEIGGKWDVYKSNQTNISTFVALDIQQELEGSHDTVRGKQVGMRLNYKF